MNRTVYWLKALCTSALMIFMNAGALASPGAAKQSANPSANQSANQPVPQSLNQAAAQSSAQSSNQAANQASRRDHYLTIEGAKFHYVEEGSGQAVIFLHGNDGSLQDFTMSMFDRIAAKYKAIAIDRPGHGESENPKHGVATPEEQARILHLAIKELKISRPLLVAHSWSGALALSYALQFPDDLCGIVMLSGMAYDTKEGAAKPSYYAVKVPMAGTAVAVLYKLAGRRDVEKQLKQAFSPDPAPKPYVDKFVAQMFRISQLKAAARDEITLNPALKNMSSKYGSIDLPVVILCGDEDKLVAPSQHSYPLHKAIPKSKLIVVKKAGHELQFTRPQEVVQAIDLALETASSWHSKPSERTEPAKAAPVD